MPWIQWPQVWLHCLYFFLFFLTHRWVFSSPCDISLLEFNSLPLLFRASGWQVSVPSQVDVLYGATYPRYFLLLGVLSLKPDNTRSMYWGCLWYYGSCNQSHKCNFSSLLENVCRIFTYFIIFSSKTLFVWQLHNIFAIWGFIDAKYIWLSIVIKT